MTDGSKMEKTESYTSQERPHWDSEDIKALKKDVGP